MRGTLPGVPPEDESWVAMIGRSTSKNVRAAKVWNLEFNLKKSFHLNAFVFKNLDEAVFRGGGVIAANLWGENFIYFRPHCSIG